MYSYLIKLSAKAVANLTSLLIEYLVLSLVSILESQWELNLSEIEDLNNIRKDILRMSFLSKAGHIPSALSMVDYLYILFKYRYLNLFEDKIVIGKTYGAQAYYVVFSKIGVFPKIELDNFGKTGHFLTHGISANFPGIDFAEETLASCLGVACGMALSLKNKNSSKKVYVNVSDASLQAGTIWEAAMFASTFNLSDIVMTVDLNRQQILCDTMGMESLDDKFVSFGWNVIQKNGHNLKDIKEAYKLAFSENYSGKPTVILFNTLKGKGVSFMEGDLNWHYMSLTEELYREAIEGIV